jgi:hypothetical protein
MQETKRFVKTMLRMRRPATTLELCRKSRACQNLSTIYFIDCSPAEERFFLPVVFMIAMKQRLLALLLILVLFPVALTAGRQMNHWYFGDRAGLDFSNGFPVAVTDGVMFAAEGCASISDKDGKLLFYTDGLTVWNRNHTVMDGGTGLKGGVSTTQAALIVPRPGSDKEYYIFTPDQAGQSNGLHYSVVDMSGDNGLGAVAGKNVPLVAPVTEKITAVRHSNSRDVWVLVHAWNNNEFYAYLVTDAGVELNPVTSVLGSFHGGDEGNAIGTMKFSMQGNKLAITVLNASSFEVFDFDATTGVVSNPLLFPQEYPFTYGLEFSPDGSLLYVGVSGQKKGIYQFDLEAGSVADIFASGQRIDNIESGFAGALQLGPDGNIYVVRLAEEFVGAITDPDMRGRQCSYVDQYMYLNGRSGRLGLPGFIQSDIPVPVRYTATYTCFGEQTIFRIASDMPVDSVEWDFGDPASGANNISNELEPVHIFSAPGIYEVTLYTYVGGEKGGFRRSLEIRPVPQAGFRADTLELCTGGILALETIVGNEKFLWSTGETGPTIRVPGSGVYWVKVSNGECEIVDSVVVREGTFALAITADTISICHGGTGRLQAAGAVRYEWTPAGTLDDPTSATPIAAPSVSTLYTVHAWDDKGCEAERQVFVRVLSNTVLRFSIPDMVATVGETGFSIPVLVYTNPELLPLRIPVLTVEVGLKTTFFQLESVTDGIIQRQKDRVVIELNDVILTQPEQRLSAVQGMVLAGDSTQTSIDIRSVMLNECQQSNIKSGSLTLQGCAIGRREVEFGTSVRLSARPNPTVDNLIIEVLTSLHDTYHLVLYTATGRALWQSQFTGTGIEEELHNFTIPAGEFPPGFYYAVLFSSRTPTSVGITITK